MQKSDKKSFTVVELIVAAAIMVIFGALLVTGLTQNYSVFQTNNIVNAFQNDARLSILKINKDLRRSAPTQIAITKNHPVAGTDRLIYHLPGLDANADPIVSGGTLQWNTDDIALYVSSGNLVRADTSGTEVLAKNVKAITFIDINQDPDLYMDELKFSLEFEAAGYGSRQHRHKTTSVVNMRN